MLLATDLEVGIRISVPGMDVETPATRCCPSLASARFFAKAPTRSCISKAIGKARWCAASAASSNCRPKTRRSFPPWRRSTTRNFTSWPRRLFREMIRRTIFATDNESSRYALGGVLLEMGGDKIIGVGTDGRRLAKMEGPAPQRRRASNRREHDDRPHQGHAADRAGLDRRRRRNPNCRPPQRGAGPQRRGPRFIRGWSKAASRNGATCFRTAATW